jgi:phosphoglycolate phosphatase
MTLQKPRAVIFDWDDTIVSNWDTAVIALNSALEHMGMEPWTNEEAMLRCGTSARDLFTRLFDDKWQEANEVYYKTFSELTKNNVRIHTHAEDILKNLHANGIYLAVVSNKRGEHLRKEVADVGFAPYFSKIVGAGDAEADKPDPAPVLMALSGSGIEPGHDVWFIGDSHIDMMCATRTGCFPILIETKIPPAGLLADHPPLYRFKRHSDIMEWIRAHLA